MIGVDIIVFGDSIAYGIGDREKGGWVNRLRLYYSNMDDLCIYNQSISGEITSQTVLRIGQECLARYTDRKEMIIVLAVGINDTQIINGKQRVDFTTYEENLITLIDIAKQYTNNVLFLGYHKVDEQKVSPVYWDSSKRYNNVLISNYNMILRHICKTYNVIYIDIFNLLSYKNLDDGLHPNEIGHHIIYENVLKKVSLILKNSSIKE